MYQIFLVLIIFLQFLKMAPAPNFGVFLNFAHSFLTEVDFKKTFKKRVMTQKMLGTTDLI